MDAQAILHKLTHAEGLPRLALKAASAQRDEMLPLFVQEIEHFLAVDPGARAKPTPLFFIFHLLGEWRAKAAYRPLARLLRLPGREVDEIFGDGITTTSHRVIAAVFDGDPEPLYDITLDPKAEEFIRAGMCEALAMVTLRGNSIGQWQTGSSATPSWRCGRCTVVSDAGADLRAGGGARHKPKQCHRPAGTPNSSATAAIPTGGG